MSGSQFVELIDRYFLDLIGTVIPGIVLIIGVCSIAVPPLPHWLQFLALSGLISSSSLSLQNALLLLAAGYILGHFLNAVGTQVVKNAIGKVATKLRRKSGQGEVNGATLPLFYSEEELETWVTQRELYVSFQNTAKKELDVKSADEMKIGYRDWRDLALTASEDEAYLARRFMFLSLLCLNTAVAMMIVATLGLALFFSGLATLSTTQIIVLSLSIAVFCYFLIERHYFFNRMSISVPFSLALIKKFKKSAITESQDHPDSNSETS